MNKTAVFICGPTAVGKTSFAIEIARWLNTDIISFDSRQFFRELKIGAAPPSPEELKEVKHHLIGHLSIEDTYNARDFESDTLKILEDLFKSKDTVVLTGGSGLYMQVLTDGFDDIPDISPEYREELNRALAEQGLESLRNELYEKDPSYYEAVDLHNPQRIIRALEVIRSTGKTYSEFRKDQKAMRPFHIIKIGLNMPRELLYERINKRVDKMMAAGLVEEVLSLTAHRDTNALQTVGYKELFSYFDGKMNLGEAIDEIKKNSRRYAKRQITWFKRDPEIKWFEPGDVDGVKEYLNFIAKEIKLNLR